MTDDKPRCDKCNRRLRPKPKWRHRILVDGSPVYIGPTCRKKLIAAGTPESAFELAVTKVDK